MLDTLAITTIAAGATGFIIRDWDIDEALRDGPMSVEITYFVEYSPRRGVEDNVTVLELSMQTGVVTLEGKAPALWAGYVAAVALRDAGLSVSIRSINA